MNNRQIETPAVETGDVIGRVSLDDTFAAQKLERHLDGILDSVRSQRIVIVCVGTDRSTGDAFGPIIGSRLCHNLLIPNVDVLGTLDEPVHAVNLSATLDKIETIYSERPFIIAIDACLGKFDHVGQIAIERGPLRPGAGVKKVLPEFGDLTITGIVNVSGFMEYFVLQNTRLGIVMRMSDIVAQALSSSLQTWQRSTAMRVGM
ncbi:putative sporulation protein YyaC [Alicyclobacillus sacchari]|uniref:Putative sporulation protein YyaC n=1 Tax=Alicyclobacillus sacchari TaxID=392010 RepID=A0A4R8LJE6_9BACL|nr:spore protease YyaC [Alicyclobacillus sacchari]TDY42392.1 putative sporulation protein YyaC [Alicyclobacillus sacchari]GMA57328.1 spore protease YyaC [Alicyclobacillus sacchari]